MLCCRPNMFTTCYNRIVNACQPFPLAHPAFRPHSIISAALPRVILGRQITSITRTGYRKTSCAPSFNASELRANLDPPQVSKYWPQLRRHFFSRHETFLPVVNKSSASNIRHPSRAKFLDSCVSYKTSSAIFRRFPPVKCSDYV